MKQVHWMIVGCCVSLVLAGTAVAQRPERPGGSGRGRAAEGEFDAPPVAASDFEKKIYATLDEMKQGPRYLNVSATDGRLLRMLAESIGAKNIVEIGTSTGESGIWFALALRSTGGHLFTHEIDEGRAKIAQENFQKAGVEDLVTIIVGDAHETVKQHKDPIDILFLDADKEGYIDYLEKLLPLVRPGGLIIAHNMNTRQADPNYVQAITTNPELETLILLREGMGVGVTMKKRRKLTTGADAPGRRALGGGPSSFPVVGRCRPRCLLRPASAVVGWNGAAGNRQLDGLPTADGTRDAAATPSALRLDGMPLARAR